MSALKPPYVPCEARPHVTCVVSPHVVGVGEVHPGIGDGVGDGKDGVEGTLRDCIPVGESDQGWILCLRHVDVEGAEGRGFSG